MSTFTKKDKKRTNKILPQNKGDVEMVNDVVVCGNR